MSNTFRNISPRMIAAMLLIAVVVTISPLLHFRTPVARSHNLIDLVNIVRATSYPGPTGDGKLFPDPWDGKKIYKIEVAAGVLLFSSWVPTGCKFQWPDGHSSFTDPCTTKDDFTNALTQFAERNPQWAELCDQVIKAFGKFGPPPALP